MAKTKKDDDSPVYDLDSLLKSDRYAGFKDILPIVMTGDELLTWAEADSKIDEFLEREVD
ncbi:MAG: hypothetical protein ACFNTU_00295 [Catonella sp.]